ncbi:hypothetical protein BH11ACT3_BH11ACT3_04600 [soil metagenome]
MTDIAAALLSAAPAPDRAAELALFGQFVGEWRAVRRSRHRGGPWTETTRTWVFGWTLGGAAVVDVQFDDEGATLSSGVRTFDAAAKLWRITWASASGSAALLTGQAYGEAGIRTEGQISGGNPIRANFSEITADSFAWDEWVAADDDGPNWELEIHVDATRSR